MTDIEDRPRIIPRNVSAYDLEYWRQHPIQWIETFLHDPETDQPFKLLDAERDFLRHAFTFTSDGRMVFSELIYSAPKKSGKTTLAAIITLTIIVLYGGRYGEAILAANDYEQAVSRVFLMCRRIIECSPLLRDEARIIQDRISIGRASIIAIPSGYESAAGSQQNIAVFDEPWAYQSERLRRLVDELCPVPTKQVACRLYVSYAGWKGESVLLEELYTRGKQQPQIAPSLYAGNGLLMAWHHLPVAPWQTERWLEEMRRSLRPHQFQRMIQNMFVDNSGSFIEMAQWDKCVDVALGHTPANPLLPVFCGLDASVKHDNTALLLTTTDKHSREIRVVDHRIFQPSAAEPLDFEDTIERTILEWSKRYQLKGVWFDPYQLASTAQRLTKAGIKMIEYPQSRPNLTACSQNLYDLIMSQSLRCYPDNNIRLAISRATAVESPRGWRIAKESSSHKIDIVVALAMSAFAAVQNMNTSGYDIFAGEEPINSNPDAVTKMQEQNRFIAQQLNSALQGQIDLHNSPQYFGGSTGRWR